MNWWKSSTGAGVSLTIKSIAAAFLPAIQNLFGIEIGSENVNAVIDAIWTLGWSIVAVMGYVRAKNAPAGGHPAPGSKYR